MILWFKKWVKLLKLIKGLLADLLFVIGHKLVIWSAFLSDYPEIANDLKCRKGHWLKSNK